ncbi:MAG: DNA translocase FtsK [Lentisphaeria bacterium]|nr:DNA translocase FtsK [Lentisphaeria bacterium]
MGKNENISVGSGNPFRVRNLFYLLGAVLFFLAVVSHDAGDFAVLSGGVSGVVNNWIGNVGAKISCNLLLLFGLAAYLLAFIVLLAAIRSFLPQKLCRTWFFIPGLLLSVTGAAVILAFDPAAFAGTCENLGLGRSDVAEYALSGGVFGQLLSAPGSEAVQPGALRLAIGPVGCILVSSTLLLAGLIMLYRSEWHSVLVGAVDAILPVGNDDLPAPAKAPAGRKSCRDDIVEMEPEKPVENKVEKEKLSFAERARRLVARTEQTAEQLKNEAAAEYAPAVQAPADELFTEVVAEEPAQEPEIAAVPAPTVRQNSVVNNSASSDATPSPHELAKPTLVQAGEKAFKVSGEKFVLPLMTMLGKGEEVAGEEPEVIAEKKELLQTVLESFKVPGEVVGHVSGPRITRYEIKLNDGVKVNKVTEIENNIAMNLRARSLRILAPIPGKNLIGVEVPNRKTESITMRSIMESEAWQNNRMEIPIVLGKDVSGEPIVIDLAQAPHLLIAGATGSGKSVCMNTLIMSLLMKFGPEELKLILVDPKVVEMADYASLPHLITPVIDDFKKVPLALRWAATEMDKRYKQLAAAGVRKLKDYNNRHLPETPVRDKDGVPIPDKLPVLLVIIDELADLMQTDAKSDIETSISRIAAKGRAAGVHIVVATQRPSRDVITGTIKSNLPTRISFRVPSLTDSRVILDQKGAEALLGMGDMLLLCPKRGLELERIQGAWVDDNDIKQVVKFVSDQAPQSFDDQVVAGNEEEDSEVASGGNSGNWSDEETDAFIDSGFELDPMVARYMQPGDDDLVRRALEIVLLEKKASTSYIQRRLKIGYNKAAEIIDLMEERGIIGPASGSGAKRDILVFDDILNQ